LRGNFDIKDLGLLKYFLGIEIAHSPKGLFISQRKYIIDLLKETEKLGCKPASTPMDRKCKLNTEEENH
jgi:Reverse transcriptase (RNA-dependent DNA polymerase)